MISDEAMMFAERVRHLRQSKELKQVQLADKLGVTKQSVSNWENGSIMPSVEMLMRIADFFHVTTDYLLAHEVQEPEFSQTLDLTGLTDCQIEHVQLIADDLRNSARDDN